MKNESGFSLVSVLVAITMFSAGVLALSRTGAEVVRVQTQASARSTAVAIARAHMEALRAQDPGDIQSESAVTVNREGQPDTGGQFTRTVNVQDVSKNLKEIRVLVSYPRAANPIELMTYAFFIGGA
ncbi:MAG: prepilin-type N-terminal cleavage/methylation domain-containing protein [Gemmatimonadota bacterium]|nr:MAG: prepilin-type N-terminal cleavage/methylation domain-containing protein [Gemmatimonadota bacterium]